MTIPSLSYTVTMDANLAREVGIPAAMLYNLLVWQSQTPMAKDYDEEGWFYCTADYFEEKTTFNQNTFTKASDILVKAGLIEKQRMYVKKGFKDANRSVTHFRIKSRNDDFQLTRNVSDTHTKCDLYNKEEKIKEKEQFTANADELSPSPDFSLGAPKQNVVSVRPNKKETDSNKKPYAVAQVVLRAWGYKFNKIGAPIAKLFKAWLDAGFTTEQIIEAGNMMKESGEEYWQKATPIQMLTENAMLWYQTNLKKKALEGMPCREIGGKTYRCDPSTGAIIEEVKF